MLSTKTKSVNKRVFEESPIDLKSETDIILFFPQGLETDILSNGFMNIHQIAHRDKEYKGYALDQIAGVLKDRAEVDDKVAGLNLGSGQSANSLRPKSAFLNIRGNYNLGKSYGVDMDYGSIGAVLKPEAKRRSAWTDDDSYTVIPSGPINRFHEDASKKPVREFSWIGTFDRIESQVLVGTANGDRSKEEIINDRVVYSKGRRVIVE